MRRATILCAIVAILVAGTAAAVDLYPAVDVTAAQKRMAAWAVIIHAYYQTMDPPLESYEISPGVTLRDAIDPLTLSSDSTVAWPDVALMTTFFNQHPQHPTVLRQWYREGKQRVRLEIALVAVSEAEDYADYDGE